jgi:UDP-N-acetylglucosamine 4,6-dehydratase
VEEHQHQESESPLNEFEKTIKKCIQDKVILITGGTGFLGRTLVERFLEYKPQSIRIFSRDEVKHYRFNNQFESHPESDRLRNLIGDVRDSERISSAMQGVDIVIHAAALKRIDMIEYNVAESIKTNILGTLNVAHAALKNQVKKALFISTDKACSPLNSYGACKLLGERIFTEMNYSKGSSETILSSVRYGNVLASTGSMIPFFKEKIKSGEPIPLTHPDMTRFIISAGQAVDLVLKALAISIGGEVIIPFIPSARTIDIIEVLKNAMGANNEIVDIGIRPGEKIHESLINEFEIPLTYKYRDIFVITSHIESYRDVKMPVYKLEGQLLTNTDMEEYSSKGHIVTKDRLTEILRELKLI